MDMRLKDLAPRRNRPRKRLRRVVEGVLGSLAAALVLFFLADGWLDQRAADFSMARGVDLLKAANHPNPTEEHLRKAADTLAAGQE